MVPGLVSVMLVTLVRGSYWMCADTNRYQRGPYSRKHPPDVRGSGDPCIN